MILTCTSTTKCASSFVCQATSVLHKDCNVLSCGSLQLLLQKELSEVKGEMNQIRHDIITKRGVKYESIFRAPLDLLLSKPAKTVAH